MASVDDYHKDHPETNAWMTDQAIPTHSGQASTSSVQARRSATVTAMSAAIQRIARRLGLDSVEVAESIPEDTIRRTKYPVRERPQPDGSTVFEHPEGIVEGVRGLVHR